MTPTARRTWRVVTAAALVVASTAAIAVLTGHPRPAAKRIAGPYAALLAASADLGPARDRQVRLTAALTSATPETSGRC